ncbi:carboxypeptidase-like regulatory domain-containing protein [Frigoribacterium sp. VKM Ac-2530]|uniref:carboxypeptidase-like regulatory domain-containing protein n=1 Tax=Frigoribacterium sp. VKM Ac-2530 TaxID=2783822 RepID=UPI00188CD046|nr:carboxypeptidase-like regulatory domain-containing protein [Frigoribacterium sp. VKM Ac-2530]MBF4579121.1 carboxypeptidase regulatory-like domain-containing protein [Frigoribacterium sp. VKM Ac-2530]
MLARSTARSARPSRLPRRASLRGLAAATTTGVVALALALGGATGASAAQGSSWGQFQVSGSARAYTGTMTLAGGFPVTTFTSTSRQATVPSGSSTWQAASTPPGAQYGTSRGLPYLNQRPSQDSPTTAGAAVTTYTFASATPSSGWSFVLGDIDADQATITATGVGGAPVTAAQLGFQGTYNYCAGTGTPSCDSAGTGDQPRWDAATATLVGNSAAADTEGAAGWFSPSVPLRTLTITYQQRSGFPVYQTWFATKTFSASGTATVGTGDAATPYAGAVVTVTNEAGRVVAVAETDAEGRWNVPSLVATAGYSATITPRGDETASPVPFALSSAGAAGLDFVFPEDAAVPATTTLTGTVFFESGPTAPGRELQILAEGTDTPSATVTADADGGFVFDGLDPEKRYAIVDVTGGGVTEFRPLAGLTEIVVPDAAATVDVTGTVSNADGSPAANETLDFVPVPDDASAQPTGPDVSVVTGPDGSFEADGLTPGADYVVVVGDDAEHPIPFAAPELGETPAPFALVVPTAAAVAVDGTVVDSAGAPAPGVVVSVLPVGSDVPVATATTDAAGRFVFADLRPGTTYRLAVTGAGDPTEFVAYVDRTLGTFALLAAEVPPVEPPVTDPGAGTPSTPPGGGAGTGGTGTGSGTSTGAAGGRGPLAFTGSDVDQPLLLAGGLLAAGLGLVAGGAALRRRRAALATAAEARSSRG